MRDHRNANYAGGMGNTVQSIRNVERSGRNEFFKRERREFGGGIVSGIRDFVNHRSVRSSLAEIVTFFGETCGYHEKFNRTSTFVDMLQSPRQNCAFSWHPLRSRDGCKVAAVRGGSCAILSRWDNSFSDIFLPIGRSERAKISSTFPARTAWE